MVSGDLPGPSQADVLKPKNKPAPEQQTPNESSERQRKTRIRIKAPEHASAEIKQQTREINAFYDGLDTLHMWNTYFTNHPVSTTFDESDPKMKALGLYRGEKPYTVEQTVQTINFLTKLSRAEVQKPDIAMSTIRQQAALLNNDGIFNTLGEAEENGGTKLSTLIEQLREQLIQQLTSDRKYTSDLLGENEPVEEERKTEEITILHKRVRGVVASAMHDLKNEYSVLSDIHSFYEGMEDPNFDQRKKNHYMEGVKSLLKKLTNYFTPASSFVSKTFDRIVSLEILTEDILMDNIPIIIEDMNYERDLRIRLPMTLTDMPSDIAKHHISYQEDLLERVLDNVMTNAYKAAKDRMVENPLHISSLTVSFAKGTYQDVLGKNLQGNETYLGLLDSTKEYVFILCDDNNGGIQNPEVLQHGFMEGETQWESQDGEGVGMYSHAEEIKKYGGMIIPLNTYSQSIAEPDKTGRKIIGARIAIALPIVA